MIAPVERKVQAGAASGAMVGLVIWALVSFVPSFRSGVPEPVAAALPFALAWAGHTLAAWAAPHTPRPDLSAKTAGPPAPSVPPSRPPVTGPPGAT